MTKPTVEDWVRARGGSAHSSAARLSGFSDHAVRRAVDAGALHRVRRSWLVTPDCDPRRVAAASVGGRATCVSAAALQGLWEVRTDEVHVALPHSASRFDPSGVIVHRGRGPVPVHPRSPDEPVLNVLFHVARCLPLPDALAIWESAVRRGAVDLDVLEQVKWRSSAPSRISALVGDRSDSGPESTFVSLMRGIGVEVRQQVWVDGHPLDAMIGDRLGVQIDGYAHHSSAADRRRDMRADARLALRGYTVLRFDTQQVMYDAPHVERTILTAMAQGLHRKR
ncbi:DUF559 domain-containing protein [uncultured Microbacterium sp.]|jgi:very-short-patch-repair endonuclease|uniref:DUF559 domain-containing protein n=1 Tax=Microbacterium algeriense TaxID=2615184 RepID=UPI002592B386|nr:DUF559 domain-containing protein [uncultured Microbacterium sp.]